MRYRWSGAKVARTPGTGRPTEAHTTADMSGRSASVGCSSASGMRTTAAMTTAAMTTALFRSGVNSG